MFCLIWLVILVSNIGIWVNDVVVVWVMVECIGLLLMVVLV